LHFVIPHCIPVTSLPMLYYSFILTMNNIIIYHTRSNYWNILVAPTIRLIVSFSSNSSNKNFSPAMLFNQINMTYWEIAHGGCGRQWFVAIVDIQLHALQLLEASKSIIPLNWSQHVSYIPQISIIVWNAECWKYRFAI
jgi:hypothetical protein